MNINQKSITINNSSRLTHIRTTNYRITIKFCNSVRIKLHFNEIITTRITTINIFF